MLQGRWSSNSVLCSLAKLEECLLVWTQHHGWRRDCSFSKSVCTHTTTLLCQRWYIYILFFPSTCHLVYYYHTIAHTDLFPPTCSINLFMYTRSQFTVLTLCYLTCMLLSSFCLHLYFLVHWRIGKHFGTDDGANAAHPCGTLPCPMSPY